MYKIKKIIYEVIEDDVNDTLAHKIFEAVIVSIIVLNVFFVILSTYKIENDFLIGFEVFSIIVFSIEFTLRLLTSDIKYPKTNKLNAMRKIIFSPLGIIDILTILPFYLSIFGLFSGFDGRVIRIIRLMRLLRILKLARYVESIRIIITVVKKRKYELIITCLISIFLIIISALLIYEVERIAQPDKFSNFLTSCWWSIATLTTIGYGDVYPITGVGRFLGAFISILGIGFIALPTGIISSGFVEEFRDSKNSEEYKYCPHCGKKIKWIYCSLH